MPAIYYFIMNILDKFQLNGKTALVTGASRGLGRAIAIAFAQAGADIVLCARGAQALEEVAKNIRSLNRKAWIFTHDFSDIRGIQNLFEKIQDTTQQIDILANVAGTNHRTKAIDFPLSEWYRVMDVNLTAPFVLSQCFAKACIKEGRSGKIVNIASLTSEAARPSIPAYTASKAGIKLLTMALAVEWAQHNINVNAIGPGYYDTELTRPLVEDEKFSEWVKQSTPMERWGVPDELCGAAVFLASNASDYMTGQTMYVDGGWLANL